MTKQQLSKLIREVTTSETEPVPGLYRAPGDRSRPAKTKKEPGLARPAKTKREPELARPERRTKKEPELSRKTFRELEPIASEKPWVTHDESGASGKEFKDQPIEAPDGEAPVPDRHSAEYYMDEFGWSRENAENYVRKIRPDDGIDPEKWKSNHPGPFSLQEAIRREIRNFLKGRA
mgnify:FL=1